MRRFDHIDLRVKNMAEAEPFYTVLLPELGFTREEGIEGWVQFGAEDGKPTSEFFGLMESPSHVPNENRIAFRADSKAEVERLAEVLHRIGARNIEGPLYEEADWYYAVFFEDPCGNRLEVCHRTHN